MLQNAVQDLQLQRLEGVAGGLLAGPPPEGTHMPGGERVAGQTALQAPGVLQPRAALEQAQELLAAPAHLAAAH